MSEFKKCACCGKEMDMVKNEYKTVMDSGIHRYVCSSQCINDFYKPNNGQPMAKMTLEEMIKIEKGIDKAYEEKKNALYIKYATEHNPYEIGDIICDSTHTIKIEKIKVHLHSWKKGPSCIYIGPNLTKKLEPFKNGETSCIYQSSVLKKLNKEN